MGYYKKPKPETIAKRILENKDKYKSQIIELKKAGVCEDYKTS